MYGVNCFEVKEARMKEIRTEILNSEKLKVVLNITIVTSHCVDANCPKFAASL